MIAVVCSADARSLVLDLVKFFHIGRMQSEQGMTDSFVAEIAPMPRAVAQEVKEGEAEKALPSIAELVTVRCVSRC